MQNHITVLIKEATDALAIAPHHVVVDATLGAGGHAREALSQMKGGVFVGLDQDVEAINKAGDLHGKDVTIHLCVGNFRAIDTHLKSLEIYEVDAILADLGWRMEQFSGNGKGFSFSVDEPLIMTYGDPALYAFNARDIVNDWKEEDIKNVLKGYGEEQFAGRIARVIVEAREEGSIETSKQLAEIVYGAVPGMYKRGRIHPATKTFQALRIAVNDELEAIEVFIHKSIQLLKPGGRLAIITFHSLEDRIVKHTFRSYAQNDSVKVLTKKPITPSDEERTNNPRSRSAKLRIIEKK